MFDSAAEAGPANADGGYFAVLGGMPSELTGYFCVGDEARVEGLAELPGVADVGVAMRPDVYARGDLGAFAATVLTQVRSLTGTDRHRATARPGNTRGLALLARLGFHPTSHHRTFVVLTR
jgi:RimJ/RimL family protein N-acetyltransferase